MGLRLPIPFSALARASARKRLWLGSAGVALFIATVFGMHTLLPAPQQPARQIGSDFIAFYTAGAFVCEGRTRELYNLSAVKQFQHDLARRYGCDIGSAYGPWWNPPFYALPFVPLSRLAYPLALDVWLSLNLACAAVSCWLLRRMLPEGTNWQSWALVPVLLVLSTPFIYAISHAQNTCTSLLLLTATVALWRSGRPLLAGAVAGMLFYKPQLAVALAAVLVLDLGWRGAAGLVLTVTTLLLVTVLALPGTLTEYFHRLPVNVYFVQAHSVYLWERHTTFKAFWRLLLQGKAPGEVRPWAFALSLASTGALAACLVRTLWIARRATLQRDRLISAAIAATPLLMPFYFDYDLLLLSVPAVLFAAEWIERGSILSKADRWLMIAWPVLYVWLMLNPDVADKTRVNLAVPLLATVSGLLIARAGRQERSSVEATGTPLLRDAA